ncbi:MAG: hypothetical protein U5K38_06820 [Woeseiaceae bacterium]|nr:hypothetical protein [Woeseiaceae bacterium]
MQLGQDLSDEQVAELARSPQGADRQYAETLGAPESVPFELPEGVE